jgi:hypothetical protein
MICHLFWYADNERQKCVLKNVSPQLHIGQQCEWLSDTPSEFCIFVCFENFNSTVVAHFVR